MEDTDELQTLTGLKFIQSFSFLTYYPTGGVYSCLRGGDSDVMSSLKGSFFRKYHEHAENTTK